MGTRGRAQRLITPKIRFFYRNLAEPLNLQGKLQGKKEIILCALRERNYCMAQHTRRSQSLIGPCFRRTSTSSSCHVALRPSALTTNTSQPHIPTFHMKSLGSSSIRVTHPISILRIDDLGRKLTPAIPLYGLPENRTSAVLVALKPLEL
jgi:hypothetical protein